MLKVCFKTLRVMMVMAICIRCGDGKLLVRPRDTVALVGDLTYLNCSTDEPDGKIQWLKGDTHIYAGAGILNNFDETRFSVELDNKTGSCNLVIQNVTLEDAGSYSCKDVKDIDNPSVAALTILDSGPVCSSNVDSSGLLGQSDCNIIPEVLNLSCSVTYHGNTPPTLQWKSDKGPRQAITSGEHCKVFRNGTMNGGRVECNMKVNAELYLHNSYLVCQTNSSAIEQYSCSSGPIKVLYLENADLDAFSSFNVIEKIVNETVRCSANSTAQCNYKWLLNNTVIDDGSSTLALRRPGVHRCEATCSMRGYHCPVTAMLVHVNTGPEPKTGAETSTATIAMYTSSILAIVFGALLLLSIISIICLLLHLRRYKNKHRRNRVSEENHELENPISNISKTEGNDVTTGGEEGHPFLNPEPEKNRPELEASTSQSFTEQPASFLSTTCTEDSAIIVGLDNGVTITKEVLKIDLNGLQESQYVEEVPTSIQKEAAASVYEDTVYVVGLGTDTNEIWKYESNSGWNKCAPLIQGRRRHSAAFVDEVLYICGGFVDRDKSVLDSVEAYNAIDNTCKSVGSLKIPVQNSGNCVAYKKSLYIFGGGDKDYKAISDVQVYDTVQNTCHRLKKPLPVAHGLMRAALWRDSVILLGGRNCFIYDFSNETWLVREQFKTNVNYFGLALSNDRIYVIGGRTSSTDAKGKDTLTCTDEVKSVSIEKIVEDKPVQWKVHGRLPRPCLVSLFAHLNQQQHNSQE